jgi:hypothetical protein
MAQIELRHATVRLLDGYSAAAAVNNGAGYAIGAVTMTIDGSPGTAIPLLASFHVVGSEIRYIVTARSGGPPTTSITFTPALDAAVLDDAVITFDGRALEIKIGTGNLTYDEKRTMDYTLDRGNLDTVREGDQVPMDVKFDFIWEFLTASSGNDPTIEDVLKNRGEAASWVTSSSDACEPYAIDIEVEYIPPCGGELVEAIRLPDFRQESVAHDLKAGTVAVTGKCNSTQAIDVRVTGS